MPKLPIISQSICKLVCFYSDAVYSIRISDKTVNFASPSLDVFMPYGRKVTIFMTASDEFMQLRTLNKVRLNDGNYAVCLYLHGNEPNKWRNPFVYSVANL